MAWTVTVEVAFATDPLDTTPTWTDISAYALEPAEITFGRGDEFSQVQPATLRLPLKNFDGRFTFGYVSGAYYPNVQPGKRIRVSVTRDGLTGDSSTFETGVGSWVASTNVTVSRTGAQAHSGSGALQLSSVAAGDMTARHASAVTGGRVVTAGSSYTATAWFRAAASARNCQVVVNWYDSAAAFISSSSSTAVADSTSAWTQVSVTASAPATAYYAVAYVKVVSTGAASEVHYVDDAQLSDGPYVRFDGHVDGWQTSWPANPDYAVCEVVATDRLKRFGEAGELRSMVEEEVLYDAAALTNLLTGNTASFDATVGTWAAESNMAAPTRTAAEGHTAAGAMVMSSSAAGHMVARHAAAPGLTNGLPADPSTAYLAETWVKTAASARSCQVGVNWYDADGTFLQTDYGATATDSTSAWTRVTLSVTSPPTAYRAVVLVRVQSTGAASEVHWADDVVLEADGHRLAYYPLSEPSGSSTAANVSVSPQDPATIGQIGSGGTLEFGSGTGPGTDGLPAVVLTPADASNGRYLQAMLQSPVGSTAGVSLEVWFNTTANTRRIVELAADASSSFGDLGFNSLSLNITSVTKFLQAERYIGSNVYTLTSNPTAVDDGLTHHAVITESISGTTVTATLYLDGSSVSSTTYTYGSIMSAGQLFIGGRPNNSGSWGMFSGTLSHVAAHSTALSAGRVADHYAAGANGLSGERSDQRVGRLADYLAIPSADRALDTGNSTVGAQSTSGSNAIAAMRQVEVTESGVLFMAAGKLTLHNRSRRYNQAVDVTLPSTQVGLPTTFPGDDFGLTNDMTVSRPNAAPARATNQASIAAYGLYRDSLEIVADTDAGQTALANWRVNNYATPQVRVPNVTVEVARLERDSPSLVAGVLGATIGSKFQLSGLPASAPASSVELFVEGWTETLGSVAWQIVFNASPASFADVWSLGTSGASELGLTTKLAA